MLLLNNGANPNLSDYHRSTPLHRACVRDDPDMVELLLIFKAKTEVHDSHGIGPIHKAVQQTSSSCLEHLVRFGADIEFETAGGETPLIWACRQANVQNLECSGLLIEAGADMYHCPPESDMSPLRSAWQRRKVETVIQLLLADFDITRESWIKENDEQSQDTQRLYVWHRALYLTILSFKQPQPNLRTSCRHLIRHLISQLHPGQSLIQPISSLEIPNIMKNFLLMKEVPRSPVATERLKRTDQRLKNLYHGDEYCSIALDDD